MFYRVTADLLFDRLDEATDFFHDCQRACPKSVVINEGEENEERGHCEILHCRHDEDPALPCDKIDEIDCPPN